MQEVKNGPFRVTSRTGFFSKDRVNVWKNGRPFYQYEKNGRINFNLPPGNYFTYTNLWELDKPVEYEFKRTRKREKHHFDAPNQVIVVFRHNPNKASIFLNEGIVILDLRFKEMPEEVLTYILYHEIGHYFYSTEHFCDEYAQERMLREGYNKSQILKASALSLGPENDRNRKCIHNVIKSKMK